MFHATEAPVRSPEESCMDRAAVRRTKAQSHLSPGQSHFTSQPHAGTVPCFTCSSCILLHSRTTEYEHYDVPYPERVAAPYTLTREQQQSPIKPSRKTALICLHWLLCTPTGLGSGLALILSTGRPQKGVCRPGEVARKVKEAEEALSPLGQWKDTSGV